MVAVRHITYLYGDKPDAFYEEWRPSGTTSDDVTYLSELL